MRLLSMVVPGRTYSQTVVCRRHVSGPRRRVSAPEDLKVSG
jgi:hypothetical protein